MTKKQFFSILIPTFNRAKDLDFALFCILRQNFSNFEIIISDNFSNDNTFNIIRKYKDKRIKYFRNKKNVPYLQNVKNAISHAKGEYVFFHADDDFLLYKNSLSEIFNTIKKTRAGYVRVNYLCFTSNKKNLFNYNLSKHLNQDKKILKNSSSGKIVSFIFDSDATFITGIVFKNVLPKKIQFVELIPWIDILFFNIQKHGGYFISKPHILASWSQWVMRDNEPHHLYSLRDGKLVYEAQYKYIQSKLTREEYKAFLHKRLMISFIAILPAIKVYVGDKEVKKLISRLKVLDPTIDKSFIYWIYYLSTNIIPRNILKVTKEVYFRLYVRSLMVHDKKIQKNLEALRQEYSRIKTER